MLHSEVYNWLRGERQTEEHSCQEGEGRDEENEDQQEDHVRAERHDAVDSDKHIHEDQDEGEGCIEWLSVESTRESVVGNGTRIRHKSDGERNPEASEGSEHGRWERVAEDPL